MLFTFVDTLNIVPPIIVFSVSYEVLSVKNNRNPTVAKTARRKSFFRFPRTVFCRCTYLWRVVFYFMFDVMFFFYFRILHFICLYVNIGERDIDIGVLGQFFLS